mmetsp:Transcript_97557/g.275993  ORF Transcript_97557/g.275993 Transcript_97557/m.275993 type:complete len:221 (+) Transcript_97557:987-1649(+)
MKEAKHDHHVWIVKPVAVLVVDQQPSQEQGHPERVDGHPKQRCKHHGKVLLRPTDNVGLCEQSWHVKEPALEGHHEEPRDAGLVHERGDDPAGHQLLAREPLRERDKYRHAEQHPAGHPDPAQQDPRLEPRQLREEHRQRALARDAEGRGAGPREYPGKQLPRIDVCRQRDICRCRGCDNVHELAVAHKLLKNDAVHALGLAGVGHEHGGSKPRPEAEDH